MEQQEKLCDDVETVREFTRGVAVGVETTVTAASSALLSRFTK